MLFTGSVSDNLQIKKQYNPETNADLLCRKQQLCKKKKKKLWAYQIATEITQSIHWAIFSSASSVVCQANANY